MLLGRPSDSVNIPSPSSFEVDSSRPENAPWLGLMFIGAVLPDEMISDSLDRDCFGLAIAMASPSLLNIKSSENDFDSSCLGKGRLVVVLDLRGALVLNSMLELMDAGKTGDIESRLLGHNRIFSSFISRCMMPFSCI
jgi:hypothetical protein